MVVLYLFACRKSEKPLIAKIINFRGFIKEGKCHVLSTPSMNKYDCV